MISKFLNSKILILNNKRRGILTSPLMGCLMVPKGGFEPPRGLPTTPSRWRVYQFHHFGIDPLSKKVNPVQRLYSIAVLQFKLQYSSTAIRQHFLTSSARAQALEVEPANQMNLQEQSERAFLS